MTQTSWPCLLRRDRLSAPRAWPAVGTWPHVILPNNKVTGCLGARLSPASFLPSMSLSLQSVKWGLTSPMRLEVATLKS